ncbi:MAG: molybdenum ABC transporter ATP-binding protein [Rhizobiales bacterium]|nr:molybdenum ABC transporter ATP-binding protein [Hyphomicrobiales bacterium]
MSVEVDIAHRLGSFEVAASFRSAGRLTALFGRSGAGKTTIVNAIAGLIRPDRGRISVDGEIFVDTAAGIFVPRQKRRIGYVFQEGRLFPHLTVRQNLAYGRWFAGRHAGPDTSAEVIELLGISHLLKRRPGALSGGEKSRVAIGRALLATPRLLLMDEPLASLDEGRKAEILPYVERLRDELKVPIVYVSHSVAEVARLATTIVVISNGRVEAVGPASQMLARPGMFPLAGRHEAGGILSARVKAHDALDELTTLKSPAGDIVVPRMDAAVGSELRIHIRARDIILASDPPTGISALNILPALVVEIGEASGPIVDVALDLGGERLLARVTRRSLRNLGIAPGRRVHAVLKSIAIGRRNIGHVADDTR